MTHGERVKMVRKELHLTLEKFGEKLGVGKTAISNIEIGNRNLTEQMALSICREFRVNYYWLMNGDGEMFTGVPDCILDELVEEYNLDELDRQILEYYLNLPEEHRKVVKEVLMNMFKK